MASHRRARLRSFLRILAPLLALYALLCLAGCVGYRRLLYPAPHDQGPLVPADATLLDLRASDGNPVQALHFPAPPGARTVVHFHGNGQSLRSELDLASELRRRGLGVLLVEYRGYGNVPGSPSEEGLYLDAQTALEALVARGVPADNVVLSGLSLGTGVAAEMAARGLGACLVLIAPYTSIPAVAGRVVPFLPVSLIVGDRFDTLAKAPRLTLPTLVIHGRDDDLIPWEMGRDLAAALPHARLFTVAGGHHNDLFALQGPAIYDAIAALARDTPAAP
ncbi:MAG: alpha/beta hydrolase [Minicystis sp.]